MTPEEAQLVMQKGCQHNPWTEDVCGNCAKECLEALLPSDMQPVCRICGKIEHTTKEHVDWQAWLTGEDDGR